MKVRLFMIGAAALALLAGVPSPAIAGGPTAVAADGRSYRWDASQPVRYVVDAGPLGSRSHATAVGLVEQAFRTWASVPTARLRFEAAGELPYDIDSKNVLPFLNGLKPGDASPVLFDSDGSILNALLGEGAADTMYGWGYPWQGDPQNGRIVTSFAVLSDAFLSSYSDGYALQAFIHELGHFLGLAHSQLHPEILYDGDPTNDRLGPAMSYWWGPNSQGHLHREDEAWFSWLYPSPEFAAQTGTIRGQVLLPDGVTGLMGVTVIARRIGDPMITAVSGVSGNWFGQVDDALRDPGRPGEFHQIKLLHEKIPAGANDLARLGEFLIPGLPPGSYTLELAQTLKEPSVGREGYLVGGPKLWREGSSAADPPTASTPIVVSAGQEVSGIDIIVNGDSLGEPSVVAEQEPNPAGAPQAVRLPAVIEGAVEENTRPAGTLIERAEEAEDLYLVALPDWTTITAILSASQPTADLDLYLFRLDEPRIFIPWAAAPGTPPEILQQRLPPGRYLVAVHHAGGPASAYTLRLLATPAPEPRDRPEPARLNYIVLGEITETSATVRWQTTEEAPTVLQYGQPLREVGSTEQTREHMVALNGLDPGSRTPLGIWTGSALQPSHQLTLVVTATAPAPNGTPQIILKSESDFITPPVLGRDYAGAKVRLANSGDGDAVNVRIEEVTPAPGWEVLSEALSGTRLPETLEVGTIGAGGEGFFMVRLLRRSGDAKPGVTIHGSYTDAAGTAHEF